MFEHIHQPLASKPVYYRRVARGILYGTGIMIACLLLGLAGYHFTAGIPWLDALHNASMILGGMGPVVQISTTGGKWFSSFYALFSGVIFITNIGVFMAPVIHRFFHKLHLENHQNADR